MCGIAGIRRFGDRPITVEMIQSLCLGLEHRGNHATGVTLQDETGKFYTCKGPIAAWEFTATDEFDTFMEEHLEEARIALVHTRFATKGTPKRNANNHPLVGQGVAVVHNGVIHNDDHLFATMKLKRSAETDSDIIRAIVAKHGITQKAIRVLSKMAGGAAAAAVSRKYPGKLLLIRSGSPLVVGSTEEFLGFCSIRKPLYSALKEWKTRFGITMRCTASDMAFVNFAEDSAWILGPEGQEWHQEFRILGAENRLGSRAYTGDYPVHESYEAKQKTFDEEEADTLEGDTTTDVKVDSSPTDSSTQNGSLAGIDFDEPQDLDYIMCPYESCGVAIALERLNTESAFKLGELSCPECKRALDGSEEG